MIVDVDILRPRLHDCKIISNKFCIFSFFEHIALRATLPCRCNLVFKYRFFEMLEH